jgi:hypothetical protein
VRATGAAQRQDLESRSREKNIAPAEQPLDRSKQPQSDSGCAGEVVLSVRSGKPRMTVKPEELVIISAKTTNTNISLPWVAH